MSRKLGEKRHIFKFLTIECILLLLNNLQNF